MYRCKECGTEYEVKPDYCDCGNDDFEIFVAPEKEEQKPQKIEKPVSQVKIQPAKKTYSEFDRVKAFFESISTIIFLSCIIASVLVLLFVANPAPKTKSEPKKAETVNIPAIDSFWDNTPVSVQKAQTEQIKTQKTETENFLQKIAIPKIIQPQAPKTVTVQTPVQSKPQTTVKVATQSKAATPVKTVQTTNNIVVNQPSLVQPKKTTQSAKTSASTPKSTMDPSLSALTQRVQTNAQNSVAQNQQKVQTTTMNTQQQTKTQNTVAKQQTTQALSIAQIPTIKAQSPTDPKSSSEKLQIDQNILKKELANYKVSLRNAIGQKINFNNVVGDGNCVVSFKVSNNGTLTNREFSQKSSNLTLNDAVYSAMTATPKFNPPPLGYKNETLHLKVNFYNGNFDISLY